MHVVVTGAAGFLGAALTSALAGAGHTVVAVDRRPQPAVAGGHRLQADLLDSRPDVVDALRSAAAVFHLAGYPGVRAAGPRARWLRVRDNVLAADAVLRAVPLAVPLVVTSSSSVYGGAPGRPSREDDPVRPLGEYAASKVGVEQLCRRRAAAGGSVCVARPFTVAGPGQRPDMAIARWLAAARGGGPLVVLGDLERRRDVTDVADAVRALVRLAEVDAQGPVNIGTGRAQTLGAMVAVVAAVTGTTPRVVVEPAPAVEPAQTLADTARLRALTGFAPTTDLLDLVRRQAAVSAPALVGAGAPG